MSEALGQDVEENYDRFIVEAFELGCVWGLESPEGWALCPSEHSDDVDVMPIWSQPEFAQAHCVDEWSIYKPVAIATEELLDEWLPGMHDDVLLVGVNWTDDMQGIECEPLDLLEDMEQEVQ